MQELLPEQWHLEVEQGGSGCQAKHPWHGLILVWVECYLVMAAILAAPYPAKVSHLFAYMCTIVRASCMFDSTAWAAYDVTFRRQAANQGMLDWEFIDTGLYNDTFAGRRKVILQCSPCLADTHNVRECPDAHVKQVDIIPVQDNKPRTRPMVGQLGQGSGSVDICQPLNSLGSGKCHFPQCRYAHLCQLCHVPHSASECGNKWQMQRNRSLMPGRLGEMKFTPPGGEAWSPC